MLEIVEKLKQTSVCHLNHVLQKILEGILDGSDESGAERPVRAHEHEILSAFTGNLDGYFDKLTCPQPAQAPLEIDFDNLSLVQNEELEIMLAVEGMVANARKRHLSAYLSLNARLNSLTDNTRVDESNSPLDPAQIFAAFKDAIQSLDADTKELLAIIRKFNAGILMHLGAVLTEANELLADAGVIADLQVGAVDRPHPSARETPRAQPQSDPEMTPFGTVREDPFQPAAENTALFSVMQGLLHPEPALPANSPLWETPSNGKSTYQPQLYSVPASLLPSGNQASAPMQPFVPDAGQQVQLVDQNKLMEILTNIQKVLETRPPHTDVEHENIEPLERLDISAALGEMLQEDQTDGVVSAVDRESSDVINLVTMLYKAIWEDESLPIPIKELIGRTQITILKVALSDTSFFNNEDHQARTLLNDFAEAGIGWTEVDDLEKDPLYNKVQVLVHRIVTDYDGDISLFENVIREFRTFRAREAAKSHALEQRILHAKERKERLDDINQLVTERINERLLGRSIDDLTREILEQPFHKFMVMLVVQEGLGTSAWKQAINTIDVLLWTVQPHHHVNDRKRLAAVNLRLLNNLRKAFRIAHVLGDEIDSLISRLTELQDSTFNRTAPEEFVEQAMPGEEAAQASAAADPGQANSDEYEDEVFDDDDPHVKQADGLRVGVWVEFAGDDDVNIRCRLAAKISAINKYIFVNRQGVKVLEKTREALAHELKSGTVIVISDGLLFSRALETVISTLRESQLQQQTGSAYQPNAQSA